jgi:hypothetical protein
MNDDRWCCLECHAEMWLASNGWVCPNGHGRIIPDVGEVQRRPDIAHTRSERARLKDFEEGIKKLSQQANQ